MYEYQRQYNLTKWNEVSESRQFEVLFFEKTGYINHGLFQRKH
jgi:hypothetical protein